MNPVDHPHGGGKVKLLVDEVSITLGQSAKGLKTEDQKGNKLIITRGKKE